MIYLTAKNTKKAQRQQSCDVTSFSFGRRPGSLLQSFCRDKTYLLHTIIDGMRQKGFPRRSLALGFLPDYHLRFFRNPRHLRDLRANVLSD